MKPNHEGHEGHEVSLPHKGGPLLPRRELPVVFREEVKPEDAENVRRIVESSGFFSPEEVQVAVELVEERLNRGPRVATTFCLPNSMAFLPDTPASDPSPARKRVTTFTGLLSTMTSELWESAGSCSQKVYGLWKASVLSASTSKPLLALSMNRRGRFTETMVLRKRRS